MTPTPVPTTAPVPTTTPIPVAPTTPAASIAAARALVPALLERAPVADAERTVAAETVALVEKAGLFHVLTPVELGGQGLDFETALLTTAELSRGCASTGWLRAVMGGNTWAVAQMDEAAQKEVLREPGHRIALQLRAGGPAAERVPGGYRLRGVRGRFCSGIDHARWILAGLDVEPAEEGRAAIPHLLLIPVEDVTVVDDWYTLGLRGTGSRSFVIDEAFVPEHRALPQAELDPLTATRPRPDGPVFRMAFTATGTVALAGVLLGTARAALDLYAGTGRHAPAVDLPALTATVDAAEALLRTDLALLTHSAVPGGSRPEQARMRRDIAYAGVRCRDVVDTVFRNAGSGGVYDSSPLQRLWRDANTAALHPTFDLTRWGGHYAAVVAAPAAPVVPTAEPMS
ncbi:acyl-CoA dehydrogenase family protein [Streptomyces antibioticus]|uniref:acyl-CoA dehydrogenase family protein n=1 Tax=Streptomyces antibioticus TaxID=1890 RepID=UPI00225914AD|nr:acyl-CoA dehydrogenase family protein [Streptomyces antibioticus]MCX5173455.1 acyl-CoA dehydrogenase family protein [Streptomyces antibioticus]